MEWVILYIVTLAVAAVAAGFAERLTGREVTRPINGFLLVLLLTPPVMIAISLLIIIRDRQDGEKGD